MRRLRRYLYNVGLALSRFGNAAILMKSPDRGMSHTFAVWRDRGCVAGKLMCGILDGIVTGHCDDALGEPLYHPGVWDD